MDNLKIFCESPDEVNFSRIALSVQRLLYVYAMHALENKDKYPSIKEDVCAAAIEYYRNNCVNRSGMALNSYQLSAVRFLQDHRGLLVYHSIGSGKTLLAVTASQCFLSSYPRARVVIITQVSLVDNFRKGMKEYGLREDDDRYAFYSFQSFMGKIKVDANDLGEHGLDFVVKKSNPQIEKVCAGNMLIIDEAHELRTRIKVEGRDFEGKMALAVIKCARCARRVLLLTATPIVNYPFELNNLMAMVRGADPLSPAEWRGMWFDPERRYKYFKDAVSVYVRKNDENYPERRDKNIFIPMSPLFLKAYKEIENKALKKIKGKIKDNPWVFLHGLRTGLLKLRFDDANKINYVVKLVRIKNKENKKVVVYSNYVDTGILEIYKILKELGINSEIFTGSTPARDRQEIVDLYNKGKIKVLLISPAGGAGIDLKGTNSIVVLDPPWNEAKLEQAVGRAIRYQSHAGLPPGDRYVEVYTIYSVKPFELTPEGEYKKEEIKDILDDPSGCEHPSADSIMLYVIEKKSKILREAGKFLEKVSVTPVPGQETISVDEKILAEEEIKKESKRSKRPIFMWVETEVPLYNKKLFPDYSVAVVRHMVYAARDGYWQNIGRHPLIKQKYGKFIGDMPSMYEVNKESKWGALAKIIELVKKLETEDPQLRADWLADGYRNIYALEYKVPKYVKKYYGQVLEYVRYDNGDVYPSDLDNYIPPVFMDWDARSIRSNFFILDRMMFDMQDMFQNLSTRDPKIYGEFFPLVFRASTVWAQARPTDRDFVFEREVVPIVEKFKREVAPAKQLEIVRPFTNPVVLERYLKRAG